MKSYNFVQINETIKCPGKKEKKNSIDANMSIIPLLLRCYPVSILLILISCIILFFFCQILFK